MENERILTEADIKRVKGLGCLRDKRYPDVFNVRILTRNGFLTSDEARAVAEAAERFGSGALAMTTRQCIEIQGVKYDNIPALIDFLAEAGLHTFTLSTKEWIENQLRKSSSSSSSAKSLLSCYQADNEFFSFVVQYLPLWVFGFNARCIGADGFFHNDSFFFGVYHIDACCYDHSVNIAPVKTFIPAGFESAVQDQPVAFFDGICPA